MTHVDLTHVEDREVHIQLARDYRQLGLRRNQKVVLESVAAEELTGDNASALARKMIAVYWGDHLFIGNIHWIDEVRFRLVRWGLGTKVFLFREVQILGCLPGS
jgi:hypothetical protein